MWCPDSRVSDAGAPILVEGPLGVVSPGVGGRVFSGWFYEGTVDQNVDTKEARDVCQQRATG